MAFCPIGVVPLGVIIDGVIPLGVMDPGVMLGVTLPLGVPPPGVMVGVAPGVSSHRDRLLLADGVGVSETILSPGCTVRGVSAQPACAGVSLSVRGVSSHLFLLALALGVVAAPWPGVSEPLLSWPGVW